MVIPSVTVSFSDIQTEFGGENPIRLSEYYGCNANVTLPTKSQPINVGIFRGVSRFPINTSNAEISQNIYKFTTNGTMVIFDSLRFDILVVGGGGGGGSGFGGGGGGGGVVYQVNIRLNTGTYTINIGNGGVAGLVNGGRTGGNGGDTNIVYNSSILNISGIPYNGIGGGGGGGGPLVVENDVLNGANGGSGGGAGSDNGYGYSKPGSATQGYTFWNGSTNVRGGGDGAYFNGYASSYRGGGGFYVNITGTNDYYGGGGPSFYQHGSFSSTYGGGGSGGYLSSGYIFQNGYPGTSGIVIFKYLGT